MLHMLNMLPLDILYTVLSVNFRMADYSIAQIFNVHTSRDTWRCQPAD